MKYGNSFVGRYEKLALQLDSLIMNSVDTTLQSRSLDTADLKVKLNQLRHEYISTIKRAMRRENVRFMPADSILMINTNFKLYRPTDFESINQFVTWQAVLYSHNRVLTTIFFSIGSGADYNFHFEKMGQFVSLKQVDQDCHVRVSFRTIQFVAKCDLINVKGLRDASGEIVKTSPIRTTANDTIVFNFRPLMTGWYFLEADYNVTMTTGDQFKRTIEFPINLN
jgi:hypothetical protein